MAYLLKKRKVLSRSVVIIMPMLGSGQRSQFRESIVQLFLLPSRVGTVGRAVYSSLLSHL